MCVCMCGLEIYAICAIHLAIITEIAIPITFQPVISWFFNPMMGKFTPVYYNTFVFLNSLFFNTSVASVVCRIYTVYMELSREGRVKLSLSMP